MTKVVSGDYGYCARVTRNFVAMGWRIVKSKKWSDGKWSFVLEFQDV